MTHATHKVICPDGSIWAVPVHMTRAWLAARGGAVDVNEPYLASIHSLPGAMLLSEAEVFMTALSEPEPEPEPDPEAEPEPDPDVEVEVEVEVGLPEVDLP